MLPSSRQQKPASTGNARVPAGGGMTGKCQTIRLETLPFGIAILVAPAKAGSHWKRPDAGRRRDDGKCQTIGLETLPFGNATLVAPAKAGIHWNPWMPAGGGVTASVKSSGWKR